MNCESVKDSAKQGIRYQFHFGRLFFLFRFPLQDFPDTQVLQELRKDFSNETAILAKAKEQALSKATWLDELMAEKKKPNASRKTEDVNSAGLYRRICA